MCSGAVDVSMRLVRIDHFKPGNSMHGTQQLTIDGFCFHLVVACFSRGGLEMFWVQTCKPDHKI